MTETDTTRLSAELREIPALTGLPDEVFAWLTEYGEELRLAANEVYLREGEQADRLVIVLEGELHARVEGPERDGQVYVIPRSEISGKLPFSRMTHYSATIRAVAPSRVFWLDVKHFPELMRRFPALLQRLVEVMSDRVREVTRVDERHDKLMALGKLSAGLAHELNNPAAAARRAAQHLGERLQTLNRLCLTLSHQTLTAEQIAFLTEFQREAAECLTAAPALDPLAESECEEEIGDWLESRTDRRRMETRADLRARGTASGRVGGVGRVSEGAGAQRRAAMARSRLVLAGTGQGDRAQYDAHLRSGARDQRVFVHGSRGLAGGGCASGVGEHARHTRP